MNYRQLGRTGLRISEIGYGAWGIGGTQWLGATDEGSLAALRRAFELGLNFIDTAYAYAEGHSETLCGRAVRESGAAVTIATKIPPRNRTWPARPGVSIDEVFPNSYITEMTEMSLKNLGVDTIDLQQFHVWNPDWTGREEWKRAVEDLKRSGKIRFFGVSLGEHQPDTGVGVIDTGLVDSVQVIYNIFDQSPERTLFPACQKHNIGVLARVPLDEGGLTGRINEETVFDASDFRAHYFRDGRKREIAERANAICADLDVPLDHLPSIALGFCLSHPAVTAVIPGMRRLSSVESNCAVSDAAPLAPAVIEKLRFHTWDRNFYM